MKKHLIIASIAVGMPFSQVFSQVWGGPSAANDYLTSTNNAFRAGKVGIGYTTSNPTLNYHLQVFDPVSTVGTRALFGSSGTILGSYAGSDAVMQLHGVGASAGSFFSLYSGINGSNNVGLVLGSTPNFGVSLSYNSSGTTAQQPFIIYGNGVERFRILTTTGTKLLLGSSGTIVGNFAANDGVLQMHSTSTSCLSLLGAKSGTNYSAITLYNNATLAQLAVGTSGYTPIPFVITNGNNEAIRVWPSGAVGIGTGSTVLNNTKFAVEGLISCRELKVVPLNASWPDYVFENNYSRLSFSELENYLSENKHLPHMKSAAQVENEQGFNIGETQMNVVRSVEELYLYVLDLKKENEELKHAIADLKNVIEQTDKK